MYKIVQPKVLHSTGIEFPSESNELEDAGKILFEKIKFGKVKISIFKEYLLSEAKQAHQDLEGRKIIGPAILVPNE